MMSHESHHDLPWLTRDLLEVTEVDELEQVKQELEMAYAERAAMRKAAEGANSTKELFRG